MKLFKIEKPFTLVHKKSGREIKVTKETTYLDYDEDKFYIKGEQDKLL